MKELCSGKPGLLCRTCLFLSRLINFVIQSESGARKETSVVPSTQHRGGRYEVSVGHLSFLQQPSVVTFQGIGSLIELRLERKLGELSRDTMAKVKDAIRFALEL
jgi:mRNA interferase MazF